MSDRYIDFVNSPFGQLVAKNLGLPSPMPLDRFDANAPVVKGTVLLGAANGSDLTDAIAKVLGNINAETLVFSDSDVQAAAASVGLNASAYAPSAEDTQKFKALVFDASGIKTSAELKALHSFFGPVIRKMSGSGRIIVIGRTPELLDDAKYTTAQRSLEGFTRAIGKEVKKGCTAQLVYVAPGADANLESTLRFFISPKSAYVSGQVVRVQATAIVGETPNWAQPLSGKVALVTGASRGIGEAIAQTLARDGAHVICLDVPQQEADLQRVASSINGSVLALDFTAADAPKAIAAHCKKSPQRLGHHRA